MSLEGLRETGDGQGPRRPNVWSMSPLFVLMINIIVIVAGFGVVWGAQGSRISATEQAMSEIKSQQFLIEKAQNDDRVVITNRLTSIEIDTKYISQAIAEIKLRLPKN